MVAGTEFAGIPAASAVPSGIGVPLLPDGIGVPELPSGIGVPLLPDGIGVPELPSGIGVPLLPSGSGVSRVAAPPLGSGASGVAAPASDGMVGVPADAGPPPADPATAAGGSTQTRRSWPPLL